jgi:hypothetical protein
LKARFQNNLLKIKKIILYREPAVPEINTSRLADFLRDALSVEVEIKDNVFKEFTNEQIRNLSRIRVIEPKKTFHEYSANEEEIEFEKRLCLDSSVMDTTAKIESAQKISDVLMYDGFELQKILRYLNTDDEILHVIITNRLTCTYDERDFRYHARTVICANPTIISTSGTIEAPAKPREYYFEIRDMKSQGLGIHSVKEKYKDKVLDYHDKRLTKILEGFVLQSIFYQITGEPFCEDLKCKINNAHWQKELLFSQLEIDELCQKHQKILSNLNSFKL